MNSISAFQSGLAGIETGINGANKNAVDIARSNDDSSTQSLTTSLVELNANTQQVEASSKVIKASSDMLGTLLDIKV